MIFNDTDPRLVESAIAFINCYYDTRAEEPDPRYVEALIDKIHKFMTYESPLFFAWGDLIQALRKAKERDFDRSFKRPRMRGRA